MEELENKLPEQLKQHQEEVMKLKKTEGQQVKTVDLVDCQGNLESKLIQQLQAQERKLAEWEEKSKLDTKNKQKLECQLAELTNKTKKISDSKLQIEQQLKEMKKKSNQNLTKIMKLSKMVCSERKFMMKRYSEEKAKNA